MSISGTVLLPIEEGEILLALINEQHQHEQGERGDRHVDIRHVKDRKIDQAEIEKIPDVGKERPVDQIAGRSGGHGTGEDPQRKIFPCRRDPSPDQPYGCQKDSGQDQEEPALILEDAEGRSCDVTVRLRPINTVVILLGLLAVTLLILLIHALRRREPRRAIHGDITVTSEVNGVVKTSAPRAPIKKGKVPLSIFTEIDRVGLDYSKCFFEGGTDAYIFLTTDRNVWWRGYETDSVRIDSGVETTVLIDEEGKEKLRIRFDSDTLDPGDTDYDGF